MKLVPCLQYIFSYYTAGFVPLAIASEIRCVFFKNHTVLGAELMNTAFSLAVLTGDNHYIGEEANSWEYACCCLSVCKRRWSKRWTFHTVARMDSTKPLSWQPMRLRMWSLFRRRNSSVDISMKFHRYDDDFIHIMSFISRKSYGRNMSWQFSLIRIRNL